jgi:hypothetical protein
LPFLPLNPCAICPKLSHSEIADSHTKRTMRVN